MEIAELTAMGIDAFTKDECPFCSESEEPEKETLPIIDDTNEDEKDPDIADDGSFTQMNNSGKLAEALSGRPNWIIKIKHPKVSEYKEIDGSRKYTIFIPNDDYHISRDFENNILVSKVCPNAHHLIPGNDSMKKATELLKWMADKVEWTTIRYKKMDFETASDYEKKAFEDEGGKSFCEKKSVSPGHEIIIKYTRPKSINNKPSSNLRVETVENIIGGRVRGKVEYDINSTNNGIWLPGANAVCGWKDLDISAPGFRIMYVLKAIEESDNRQFHDAHKEYSNNVRRSLNKLASEIEKIRTDCISKKSHNKKDPPTAPKKLVNSLDAISEQLSKILTGGKSNWSGSWLTSKKSLW